MDMKKRELMERVAAKRRKLERRGVDPDLYFALRSLMFWGTVVVILILLPILVSIQSCVSA